MEVKIRKSFGGDFKTREVSLSCTVMHALSIRERRQNVDAMISRLGETNIQKHWSDFEVIGDFHRRGTWWTARRCWRHSIETDATHHLIIQDDAVLCRDFVTGVFDVIAGFPNEIISLFALPRKGFAESSARWGEAEGPWGLAVIMPKPVLQEILEWESKNVVPECPYDDSRISMFCVKTNRTVKVPFPNLVDHSDELDSVAHACNRTRVSLDFMGERSPHDFDWHDTSTLRRSVNSYGSGKNGAFEKYLIQR